jgi:hypothetical protein
MCQICVFLKILVKLFHKIGDLKSEAEVGTIYLYHRIHGHGHTDMRPALSESNYTDK